tara:strand:+ start:940 stop:1173 length:234 start_codon:yes stop_codon:yes gene_type:complete
MKDKRPERIVYPNQRLEDTDEREVDPEITEIFEEADRIPADYLRPSSSYGIHPTNPDTYEVAVGPAGNPVAVYQRKG